MDHLQKMNNISRKTARNKKNQMSKMEKKIMVNSFENFKRALGFWPYLKMWTCYWATSTLKLICLIKKKK